MEWIYIILLALGCFFLFTATLGLFLMPDVYTRMHATTKCDTVAAGVSSLPLRCAPGTGLPPPSSCWSFSSSS